MSARRGACVLVDAYSTGNALAGVFRAYGFESMHVWSGPNMPDTFTRTFRSGDFVYDTTYDGDIDALCRQLLSKYTSIVCVVAASESGVPLADQLSERLGLPGNGSALSSARRDKAVMAQTVASANLAVIPHLASADATEIRNWIADRQLGAVVLKPTSSCGTVGFHICENDAEVVQTLPGLLGSRDAFGSRVDEVLVQPFVVGDEYCVNAVSRDGRHLVTEVWRTRKHRCSQSKVYDFETLVDPQSPVYGEVVDYVSGVLTALQISVGPSHTEVMVGPSGPVLIESAARVMGAMDISLVSRATGTNAVLLTAETYLAPHRFLARLDQPQPALVCRAAMVQLISSTHGSLTHWNLDALRGLETFHGIDTYLSPGDAVVPTVNSFSSPGLVFLAGPTDADLQRDYMRIRTMEAQGLLYEVDGEAVSDSRHTTRQAVRRLRDSQQTVDLRLP